MRSASYSLLQQGVFSGYGRQPLFHIDMYVTPTGVTGMSGKEIVFLGRPSKAREITGRYSEEAAFNHSSLDSYFDETEAQLSQIFEVQHLPLMLTKGGGGFYWLTFNNVVIENTGTSQTVVMTTYSQDSKEYGTDEKLRIDLENAAESIWRDIGYTVHKTDGLEELAKGLRSIHCITKDLARSIFVS